MLLLPLAESAHPWDYPTGMADTDKRRHVVKLVTRGVSSEAKVRNPNDG